MSDLLVRVVTVDEVRPHPNADKLEIVKVGGWQIVSGKGNYVAGQTAVHVPPNAMVPKTLADAWGVSQYLSWKSNATKGRVKAVKLRAAPSYGFLAPNDQNAPLGENLAQKLDITNYEEPVQVGMQAGQMAYQHPLFHRYTDIQNLRNYPDKLSYGEPLILAEKIHGTNSRVGWVRTPDPENGGMSDYFEQVVGTHKTQRKVEDPGLYGLPFTKYGEALGKAFDEILQTMQKPEIGAGIIVNSIIFFDEIFGGSVQDLKYGLKEPDCRFFDIAVNGNYLPWAYVEEICTKYGLPVAPTMSPAFYTFEQLCELAEGESILSPGQIKEGLVVRPLYEKTWCQGDLDPHPKRMIFKIISSDYLTRKGGTEHH